MNGRSGISVGNYRVGYLLVDPDGIRSEGGALSPALVVPATIQLDARDEGQTVAITQLEADLLLSTGPGVPTGVQLGAPAHASPLGSGGGLWSSIPAATAERALTFRFPLARSHVRLLESHAERLGDEAVALDLGLRVRAAWVRQSHQASDPSRASHPLPSTMGLVSELWPLWEPKIEPLQLRLRREDWAGRILPGLGSDHVRLIAVRLPAATKVLGADAVEAFDIARRAYDEGNVRLAVQACRDLRDAIHAHLGAVDGQRVADIVADRLGWPEGSSATQLLDNLWRTLGDVSDAAHHQRGRQVTVADARATVLIAATVMEYLADLLAPER